MPPQRDSTGEGHWRGGGQLPHLFGGDLKSEILKKQQQNKRKKNEPFSALAGEWELHTRGRGRGSVKRDIFPPFYSPPHLPHQTFFWRFLFNARTSHISHLGGATNASSAGGGGEKGREWRQGCCGWGGEVRGLRWSKFLSICCII